MTDDINVVVTIGSGVLMPKANSMANQLHNYSSAAATLSKFNHLLTTILANQLIAVTWVIPIGAITSARVAYSELNVVSLHCSIEET